MIECNFFVNCLPVPQPRQKFVSYRYSKGGRSYTPDNGIKAFREAVRREAEKNWQYEPLDVGFAAKLDFSFKRPENFNWKTQTMSRLYRACGPDADNLAKGVLDALNDLVWTDDSRVALLTVSKSIVEGLYVDGRYRFPPVGVEVHIAVLSDTYPPVDNNNFAVRSRESKK